MDEKVPHHLRRLDTLVPSWWCCLGKLRWRWRSLLKEVCLWGEGLRESIASPHFRFAFSTSFFHLKVCVLSASCSSCHTCLPVVMDSDPHGHMRSNKPFLLYVRQVLVCYHSSRKVTNQSSRGRAGLQSDRSRNTPSKDDGRGWVDGSARHRALSQGQTGREERPTTGSPSYSKREPAQCSLADTELLDL